MSSSEYTETNPRHVSASTKNMHGASTSGAQTGGAWGQRVTGAVKDGVHQSENLRQGVNAFFDNALQPSAARDADRGVTAHHKDGKNVPSVHGTEGHAVREGPARGTGTTGLTGSTASDGRTAATHTAPGSGFSGDAKAVGQGIKDKLSGSSSGTTSGR